MSDTFPRCQLVPLPDDRVSFVIDGIERTQWHFGTNAPRPFFFPVLGPSGTMLTRMGHPGAPNHDHHRSVWFAHAKVTGIDFWSDVTEARVRQKEWLAYENGDDEAVMACRIGWYDGHDPNELMEQQLVAAVRPGAEGEWFLELQTTFTPRSEMLELQQTNFGFLAVRVAAHVSEHFGGGLITNADGAEHEKNIFGRPSRWMDYSGPVPNADAGTREGITYFDHPANPSYPSKWHVREDGWMGASLCRDESIVITRAKPLVLRYLLHVHAGPLDAGRANTIADEFTKRPGFVVERGTNVKHRFWIARRSRNA